ncbi:ferritin-like domain-containing protein [Streptomyces gardneri]|uniref:ferritin-like domain-containing protein n=1 Tax=Nocardia TaxID=1817 RepID=UPI00135928D0|nr:MULTISPECIES: ferritin-like domain-containing protein [Nocardia]MBF6165734.1 ferritin-like domain-containing protein [Streptomyces gardneri]MBF6203058.1 ferritin-like domain-containing protein [Streptomyces gardneri]UAK29930.1 ferritin-like domain-containing protein [Nocardia asteroides]
MTETERRALIDALNAEYGAVYAYGVIAAYASPERTRLIAEHTAAHRARRDTTADVLALGGATVPPPDAAYTVPFPVTDPISAARLAVTVESDVAVAWRSVVERGASMTIRRTGVDALTEAALRLATWQSILGANPPTVAFPGKA